MTTWDAARCAREIGVLAATWSTYASRGLVPASVARGLWDADEVRAWAYPRIPEPDPTTPDSTYGARDGHGRYGILDQAEDGRLICHECGRGVWHLASHLHTSHQIDTHTYRQSHGLPLTAPLVSTPVRGRMGESWSGHASQHLARLAATRDPQRATQASHGVQRSAATRHTMQHPRGRALTDAEARLLDAAPDLDTWARIARGLLDDGASGATISAATGIREGTVHARVARLAPRT